MSLRRSRFELYRDLLTQVHNGNCIPTRMMYSTNMSWDALNRIKEPLIMQGLLAEVEKTGDRRIRIRYQVTEKGEEFLEYLGLAMNLGNLEEEIQI